MLLQVHNQFQVTSGPAAQRVKGETGKTGRTPGVALRRNVHLFYNAVD